MVETTGETEAEHSHRLKTGGSIRLLETKWRRMARHSGGAPSIYIQGNMTEFTLDTLPRIIKNGRTEKISLRPRRRLNRLHTKVETRTMAVPTMETQESMTGNLFSMTR